MRSRAETVGTPSRAALHSLALADVEHLRPGITFHEATPEQQRLRATLFSMFFSTHHSLPFDPVSGRSFADLRDYFSWIAPYGDWLLIGSNSPEVVASYLLPHIAVGVDGSRNLIGMAGLRLTAITPHSVVLRHLPTEAVLELVQVDASSSGVGNTGSHRSAADRADRLTSEVELSRGTASDHLRPVFETDEMSDLESKAVLPWDTQLELRSALFVRSELLWSGTDGPWIRPSLVVPGTVDLEWRSHVQSVTTRDMARNLLRPSISVDELQMRQASGRWHSIILKLHEETMFLTNRGGHVWSDWEWRNRNPGVEPLNAKPVPGPPMYAVRELRKSLTNFASLEDLRAWALRNALES